MTHTSELHIRSSAVLLINKIKLMFTICNIRNIPGKVKLLLMYCYCYEYTIMTRVSHMT